SDSLVRRRLLSRDPRGKRFGRRRMRARVLGRRRRARSWSSALVIGPPSVPATSGAEQTALLAQALALQWLAAFSRSRAPTLVAGEHRLRRPTCVVVDRSVASSLEHTSSPRWTTGFGEGWIIVLANADPRRRANPSDR